ncbi:MAG: hypothetical protein IPJ65_07765 [Archangiaceae bacterium]|nr:hypothetical protein [Archangiaceae bacterium]
MKTLFAGALLLAAPALATTLLALDVPAMSRSADAIVQGTVTRVEAKLSKDKSRISTHVFVQVSESLKGQGTSEVELVQPGGVVGDLGQRVSGTAHLKEGDEVVAFLERRGPRAFMLVGMAQGCFRIERSSDGKAAFALQDPDGEVAVLDPVTHAVVQKNTTPQKLDELKAQIRAALAQPLADEPPPGRPAVDKAVK